MKWFKHFSGSIYDDLIFESMCLFGSDGYLVFFGTLDIMSDEFDIYNPGVSRIHIKKLTKSFLLSRQKTVKILRFFDKKAKENRFKNKSFVVEFDGDYVVVTCCRLKEICDEYTDKQLKKIGTSSRDDREFIGYIEEEEEEEVDKRLDSTNVESAKAEVLGKHFSKRVGEYFNSINDSCEKIFSLPKKMGFNPYAWVQQKVNNNGHPEAIDEVLRKSLFIWETIENPWPYLDKAFAVINQNKNEADTIKIHEFLKSATAAGNIKELTAGIFKSF